MRGDTPRDVRVGPVRKPWLRRQPVPAQTPQPSVTRYTVASNTNIHGPSVAAQLPYTAPFERGRYGL